MLLVVDVFIVLDNWNESNPIRKKNNIGHCIHLFAITTYYNCGLKSQIKLYMNYIK